MRSYTEFVNGKPHRTVRAKNKTEAIRKFLEADRAEAAREGNYLEVEAHSPAARRAVGSKFETFGNGQLGIPMAWGIGPRKRKHDPFDF